MSTTAIVKRPVIDALRLLTGRFWEKVNKNGPVPTKRPDLGPCWLWTASLDGKGYGQFMLARGCLVRAHRLAYELTKGPIPVGKELDHLCKIERCVNPHHTEPVTHEENSRRGDGGLHHRLKTHCPKGHPYDDENTIHYRGERRCRECHKINNRESWRKRNGYHDRHRSKQSQAA